MEKQMLFLLDWDLRVRNEDLYQHLEPFLAPIRQHQMIQERYRQQQLLEIQAQAQRQQPTYSKYAVDEVVSSYAGSSRSSARTPSLSPPTRSTSASTPETESLDDRLESPIDDNRSYAHAQFETETGEMVVHIEPRDVMPKTMHRMRSYEEKPAKKARTGGTSSNFFARLLNGGAPQRVGAC